MGLKMPISQLYVSRFEAIIYSNYHEKIFAVNNDKQSSDYSECKRWMQKSEDLVLEISQKQEQLFKTIGLISAIFPESDKFSALVEKIYHYKTPQIKDFTDTDTSNSDTLKKIKELCIERLKKLVKDEIETPIEKLLKYIKNHIKN